MEWWEPWPRRLVKMDPDQWARLAADQPPEGALALCAAAHEWWAWMRMASIPIPEAPWHRMLEALVARASEADCVAALGSYAAFLAPAVRDREWGRLTPDDLVALAKRAGPWDDDLIRRLVQHPRAAAVLAGHQDLQRDKSWVWDLAQSPHPDVRLQLARNATCPATLLARLVVMDPDPAVRQAAAWNRGCPTEAVLAAFARGVIGPHLGRPEEVQ